MYNVNMYVRMHVRMYVCDSLHILPPKTYVHIILTNVRIRTYVITYYVRSPKPCYISTYVRRYAWKYTKAQFISVSHHTYVRTTQVQYTHT